jgi:putative flippase GtrA
MKKFVKYIAVGIVNAIFGYSLFALLIFTNVHYALAMLLTTIIGIIFNFNTIGKIVFKKNDNSLLFKFILVYAITYLLNIAGLRMFEKNNINLYLGNLLLLFPITVISFMLHSRVVFRERQVKCR